MCKLRVLIAEDHEQMRWQLVCSLSLEFDVVGSLSNGGELVDLAISLNPDVIVSDVRMPVLSGPEAMKILRRTGYNIPFVLISISSCGAEEFIRQGAAAFVEKLDIGYELAHAVRLAASGIKYLSRGVRSSIVSEADGGCLDRR
jgi:two-component system, NarL family, nitrate/nitrite response regulator NarL